MIVCMFDLSSACIGMTLAEVDKINKKITYGKTIPIIPRKLDGREYGYTTKAPKKIAHKGKEFQGFLKEDEFTISEAEAKRRISDFKAKKHNFLLRDIGSQCGRYLNKLKPEVIAIERNASFNGILTTKLLAEIAGGIYFYAGAQGTTMFDYHEATVRAKIRKDVPDFSYEKDGKQALDTKWEIYCRLREYFTKEFPGIFDFEKMTMDESDSLAVFYYYLTTEVLT